MRRMTLPPQALLLRRMEGLLFQIASTLRAEAAWGALLRELVEGGEPWASSAASTRSGERALKLLSWNVAGRTKLLGDQIAAVARREPDLVCLQEIRPSTGTAGATRWPTRARPRARLGRVLGTSGGCST